IGRAREIVAQGGRFGIEAQEPEVAIVLEFGRALQSERRLVEVAAIGLRPRNAREHAIVAISPAVIEAAEATPGAFTLGADTGPAMPAGIEEAAIFPPHIAQEEDGPACDLPGDEIVRLLQLRAVTDIDPALGKDLAHLIGQDRVRDERLAIQEKP